MLLTESVIDKPSFQTIEKSASETVSFNDYSGEDGRGESQLAVNEIKANTGCSENSMGRIRSDEGIEQDDYGRIVFVGDSRTIDMFYDSDDNIYGELHDDIVVFGGHGEGLDFLVESIEGYGLDRFDTLVVWMGANERGNFVGYGEFYSDILSAGKKMVLCTVGPTDNNYLHYNSDGYDYMDELMQQYNLSLTEWAEKNGVKIIDLYSYIKESQMVGIDPEDGIHYLPRPTTEVWKYIVKEICGSVG